MRELNLTPEKKEEEFNRRIIAEYLKYGSVDELFRANGYDLPISYPGVHRLLNRWGIVKSTGPNTKFSACIGFLVRMVEEEIPLESLYKRMPPSFRPSMTTLHRMYANVKREVKKHIEDRNLRRVGSALVITPNNNSNLVLIGHDISTPRLDVGKSYGALSLPMGFSKREEKNSESVLRVLQQEVFSKQVVYRDMVYKIPPQIVPFMYVDVADVRVAVYHLRMPEELSTIDKFTSYKITDFCFIDVSRLSGVGMKNSEIRAGTQEIAEGYLKYLSMKDISYRPDPIYVDSSLNLSLATLTLDSHY